METCLQNLINVNFICGDSPPDPAPYFWLDDIEAINEKSISEITDISHPNAQGYVDNLIAASSRNLAADIEALIPRAYSLTNIISKVCSTCTLQPLYASGSKGILIKNVSKSKFSILTIESLEVLINSSGSFSFVIDDGVTQKTITATFTAGVIQPFTGINYRTMRTAVKIYFTDNTVSQSTILCSSPGGCGCGGAKAGVNNPLVHGFVITGLQNNVENTVQYGFLPCVSISCSYDAIICELINYSPRSFGLAMLYNTASNFFINQVVSQRNNRTAGYDKEQMQKLNEKYDALYREVLTGSQNRKGLSDIINNNLSIMSSDRCVECRSPHSISYAHG